VVDSIIGVLREVFEFLLQLLRLFGRIGFEMAFDRGDDCFVFADLREEIGMLAFALMSF